MLSGIKTNMSALLVFKLLPSNKTQTVFAALIFAIFNLIPLFYSRVLYKNKDELENENKVRLFGSLYDNRNVNKDKDHRAWAFPLTFFYRRTVFACVTVFLFEKPAIQMMIF